MDDKIFLSAFSKSKEWQKDARGMAEKISKGLGGRSCDLLIFFVSEAYQDFDLKIFSDILSSVLPCGVSIGCNSSGVISSDTEIEMQPGISIMAMHLPGVKTVPFRLSAQESTEITTGAELLNFLDIYPTDKPRFICLADPISCDISQLLHSFNDGYKGLPMVGGLASAGVLGAPNWLSLDGAKYEDGAVGLALIGDIQFDVTVSQGCRPIGRPYIITKADGNILHELAGKPALDAIREMLMDLPARDKTLAARSLFMGLVMNEHQTEFKRGDFLIRNIMGSDPDTDALIIGASLKVGQTIQFQLRDAQTSEEDLKLLLEKMPKAKKAGARGAILVSCCGRGKGLYGFSNHDVSMIQSAAGPLPLAGFFANGEFGPIGSKNYVHGYTSSLVILS